KDSASREIHGRCAASHTHFNEYAPPPVTDRRIPGEHERTMARRHQAEVDSIPISTDDVADDRRVHGAVDNDPDLETARLIASHPYTVVHPEAGSAWAGGPRPDQHVGACLRGVAGKRHAPGKLAAQGSVPDDAKDRHIARDLLAASARDRKSSVDPPEL